MKINTNKLATEIVKNIQEFQKETAKYREYSEQEREKIRELQKEKLIDLVEFVLRINLTIESMKEVEPIQLIIEEEPTKKAIALLMEILEKV